MAPPPVGGGPITQRRPAPLTGLTRDAVGTVDLKGLSFATCEVAPDVLPVLFDALLPVPDCAASEYRQVRERVAADVSRAVGAPQRHARLCSRDRGLA